MGRFLRTLWLGVAAVPSLCGQTADVPTIHAHTRLGVTNVIVADKHSGVPITTLDQSDFLLSANNNPNITLNLRIVHFDHETSALRPLTVWLITECVAPKRDTTDSAFFRGQEEALIPGLSSLSQEDAVGVAHWCGDGESYIDMKPRNDPGAAAKQVQANLSTPLQPSAHVTLRGRQLGLESLVKLLDYYTIKARTESRPVFVFLHEGTIDIPVDTSKGPFGEGNFETNQLLSANAICFVVNDGRNYRFKRGGFHERTEPVVGPTLYGFAYWTGGRQIIVEGSRYDSALDQILVTLHSRYELSFLPFSAGFYNIDVELTKEAKNRFPNAELQHRRGFFLANEVSGVAQ